MRRRGSAVWKGALMGGTGTLSTESKVLSNTPYSFSSRFENGVGTNPEELVGAAHAGCFSMALSGQLERAGLKAESIETSAIVSLERLDQGWTVTQVHLDVTARVPNAGAEAFMKAAEEAKKNCPISRLLNAKVSMEARLA